MEQEYYPQIDLSKLSDSEIEDKWVSVTKDATYHAQMVNAKDYAEQVATQGAFKALNEERLRIEAEKLRRKSS